MRKAAISFVVSVGRSEWNRLTPTGGILTKFRIRVFFEQLPEKIQLSLKLTRITVTLYEDQYSL